MSKYVISCKSKDLKIWLHLVLCIMRTELTERRQEGLEFFYLCIHKLFQQLSFSFIINWFCTEHLCKNLFLFFKMNRFLDLACRSHSILNSVKYFQYVNYYAIEIDAFLIWALLDRVQNVLNVLLLKGEISVTAS